ncbi:non-specific lipid-transfer protein-like protein [Panicum miliaceum]|uniref:Non-specific lipid-transfer protein-like protein n=1 Tax=Panicum miliaceum TaxID=4540 RepID=A0A3L6TU04_PANMI|nr:non-specific lipid-transfer protein-like protein [Panicum miliaceum]
MAQRRQRRFPPVTMPCLALAVVAVMCAASTTTAQPQPPPLPLPLPQQPATTTTTPAVPSLPAACPPAQATLSPCLGFFIGNSSSPPAECCAQIWAMFQSQAPCLCAAMASGPAQLGLGSAIGQLLPSSCDLPANACSGSGAASGAPAGPTTTPASGSGTTAAAAPETGPTGVDPAAAAGAGAGAGGVKSVPGVLDSGAAASGYRGVSAAAALMPLVVAYIL